VSTWDDLDELLREVEGPPAIPAGTPVADAVSALVTPVLEPYSRVDQLIYDQVHTLEMAAFSVFGPKAGPGGSSTTGSVEVGFDIDEWVPLQRMFGAHKEVEEHFDVRIRYEIGLAPTPSTATTTSPASFSTARLDLGGRDSDGTSGGRHHDGNWRLAGRGRHHDGVLALVGPHVYPAGRPSAARREIRAATGREGTDLHLSMTAALALSRHPSILALLKYTDRQGHLAGIPCVLRGLVVRVVPVMKDAAILGPAVIGGPSDRWFLITGVDAKPSLWLRLRHRLHPGNTPQQRAEALSAGLPSNPPRGRHG